MWRMYLDGPRLNGDDRHGLEVKKWGWWWTRLLPLLLWIGTILWVAALPKTSPLTPGANSVYGMPKWVLAYSSHISAFFILAILFQRCLLESRDRQTWQRLEAFSVLGCALVAICSELIQLGVPTRTPSVYDLAGDLVGAILGIAVMRRSCTTALKSRTRSNLSV